MRGNVNGAITTDDFLKLDEAPADVTLEFIEGEVRAGVPQVWVADPEFRTITVHRRDVKPKLFTPSRR